MKLIGLTGLPRSGKDTFAKHMIENYGYTKLAFATPLKQAAAVLLNREVWEMEGEQGFDREAMLPEWGFSTRHFLRYLGTEAMRNYQADFWIRRMRSAMAGKDKIVITDCRFENEVDLVHEFGGKVIQLYRPGCEASDHVSDLPVRSDMGLMNGGTLEDMERAITHMVEDYQWA